MRASKRYVFKVKEVMALLKTGNPATLEVCSLNVSKPSEKDGRRLKLVNVIYSSNDGFKLCNVRLANGDTASFHPVLLERFNGTKVTP